MTDNFLQIDVTEPVEGFAYNLGIYTPYGYFKAVMSRQEYEDAKRAGFFIRDGKEKDSAGVTNTTEMFFTKA